MRGKIVFASLFLVFGAELCPADVDARGIALNCYNCHRDDSEADEPAIPSLTKLSEQQLKQMLLDFKYDKTRATLMPRLAKGYSDQELAAVAAYLSQH